MKALELLEKLRDDDKYIFGASEKDLKVYYEAIAELQELMKPKTCISCENYLMDRTIFYDGKKALMCTFCKHGAVSYFKPKDTQCGL